MVFPSVLEQGYLEPAVLTALRLAEGICKNPGGGKFRRNTPQRPTSPRGRKDIQFVDYVNINLLSTSDDGEQDGTKSPSRGPECERQGGKPRQEYDDFR